MKLLRFSLKVLFCILLSGAGILFADCPEGTRPTTAAEQQHYEANMQALKASTPRRSGWLATAAGAVYSGCTNERLQGIETGAGGGCNLCLAYGTEAERGAQS